MQELQPPPQTPFWKQAKRQVPPHNYENPRAVKRLRFDDEQLRVIRLKNKK